jgi:hypothetical protein
MNTVTGFNNHIQHSPKMRFSYEDIDAKLQGRCRLSRKEANNTYLHRHDNGDFALRFHNTDIILWHPDSTMQLFSGGWKTITTKERINRYLPRGIVLLQNQGVWYLGRGWKDHSRIKDYSRVFAEGVTIHPDGSVTGYELDNMKEVNAFKKKVRDYAKLCVSKIPLDEPAPGDCWYCHMTTTEGESLGDAVKDSSHLLSHIEEGYVVPSLVFRAMKESRRGSYWFAEVFGKVQARKDNDKWFERTITRIIYRYIMRRCGYAV